MKQAQIQTIGALIVGLIVIAVLIFILIDRGQDPAITTINDVQRRAQLTACDQRLPDSVSFTSSDPIQGDRFARTVALCGSCVKSVGGQDSYFLLDVDQDGIPDECDASPSATPAQLDQKHSDQCLGSLVNIGGIVRCCVGDSTIERYCLP